MIVDEDSVTYKTGKITVDSRFRNLILRRDDISSLSWKWIVFPVATFEMKDGERFSFMIFNKWRFAKVFARINDQNR